MWPTPNNANKNNCAVIPAQSFRANDWYLFDLQNPNLAPISRINRMFSPELSLALWQRLMCCSELGLREGDESSCDYESNLWLLDTCLRQ